MTPVIIPMNTCYDCPPPTSHEWIVATVMAILAGLILLGLSWLGHRKSSSFMDAWEDLADFGWYFGWGALGLTALVWAIYGLYLLVEVIV